MISLSMTPVKSIVVPKYRRDAIVAAIRRGERVDGRRYSDFRKIEVVLNPVAKANGSAQVKIGDTMVITGAKAEISSPFPDTPNEGVLQVHAEFVPLASPIFEAGPPDENAIEVARVVDRGLRESRFVKLDELVIIPGRRVWSIYVDIYLLDHGGNIIDASMLSSTLAIYTCKLPKFNVSGDEIIVERDSLDKPLPLNDPVVSVTIGVIEEYLLVDPSMDEEAVIDGKLTFIFDKKGNVAGLQKMGARGIKMKTLEQAMELAMKKSQELLGLIEKVISSSGDYSKPLA